MVNNKVTDFSVPLIPITIETTRRLLGIEAKGMSDEEIVALVNHLDSLAQLLIEMYKVQKTSQQ